MDAARAALFSQLDAVEVVPGLWIGAAPPQGDLLSELGFDALVLCARQYQPAKGRFPGVEVYHAGFRDTEDVTPDELRLAVKAAQWTSRRLRKGKKVLVTCMAGLNRSGLVTALSLAMAGRLDPAMCGELVKRARGPDALSNPTFVDALNRVRHNPGRDPCQLCVNEKITPRYYEDHVCWVAICKDCGVPMVVLRRHSVTPTDEEKEHMRRILFRAFGAWAPGWAMRLDEKRRTIPDHWHAHARPT